LLWKNWLKQQVLIELLTEHFGDQIEKQGIKEGDQEKERKYQIQNKGSQFKIDNNQKNEKNYFHYTEVDK
jgi:23S rRNA-/tRNA-specific pseudouridylate synthase